MEGAVVSQPALLSGSPALLKASGPLGPGGAVPERRVINISRRVHPSIGTVQAELADPASWDRITTLISAELASFTGERAIFIHNANLPGNGFVGEADPLNTVIGCWPMRPRRSSWVMRSSTASSHGICAVACFVVTERMREKCATRVYEEQLRRDPDARAIQDAINSGRGGAADGVAQTISGSWFPSSNEQLESGLFIGEYIEGAEGQTTYTRDGQTVT